MDSKGASRMAIGPFQSGYQREKFREFLEATVIPEKGNVTHVVKYVDQVPNGRVSFRPEQVPEFLALNQPY